MHIYIHIPYCAQLCSYCDFCKKTVDDPKEIDSYLYSLTNEMQERLSGACTADTLYIGGGTPSRLGFAQLSTLFSLLANHSPLVPGGEYTMEVDPCTLTAKQLELLASTSINRISIGAQSWNDQILEEMGRIHRVSDTEQLIADLKAAGFRNISIDLIVGWPNQTTDDIQQALTAIARLDIQHVSIYMLMLEQGTPLEADVNVGEVALPTDDLSATLYETIQQGLTDFGFRQYEISNFAKPGFESQHNLAYWSHHSHKGFGAGAASLEAETRIQNSKDIDEYVSDWREGRDIEHLSRKDVLNERLMMGLRTPEGIESTAVEHVSAVHIDMLIDKKLLISCDRRIRLPPSGYVISNSIIATLLHD